MLDSRTALVTARAFDRLAGMFRHRERIQMSRRIQMGTWVPFEGPRGGHGAKSVETGEVVYGEAGRELLKSRTNALDDITTSGNNKVSGGDTHSSAKGKEMEATKSGFDLLQEMIAAHSPHLVARLESLGATERGKVSEYIGDSKNRVNKIRNRLQQGKRPLVPESEDEQKARAETERLAEFEAAEKKRQKAIEAASKQKAAVASDPLERRAADEVGWRVEPRGARVYVTGTRRGDPAVTRLRTLGAHWDAENQAWWVGKAKLKQVSELAEKVNDKKTAGKADAVARKSQGLAITIPFANEKARTAAKKLGARWDAVDKQWLMPDDDSRAAIMAMLKADADKSREAALEESRKAAKKELERISKKTPEGGRVFTKTTDMRGQGYREGSRIRDRDGNLWVVTGVDSPERFEDGLSYGQGRDDGYSHTAYARPATAEEDAESKKATRIAELDETMRILGVGPDDDRDRERHNQRIRDTMAELNSLRNSS